MKYTYAYILICIFVLIQFSVTAQNKNHVELLSVVKPPENSSSIWGYTSPAGEEYGILGTSQGVRIYALSDPTQPKELIFIKSNKCLWRELKSYEHYIYVVSECNDSLLIIDMAIPDSIRYKYVGTLYNKNNEPTLMLTSHTIYIDEKGYIYLCGARDIGNGFAILDPHQDPWQPTILFDYKDAYMHEVHAYKDVFYGAELFNGVFSIWDIKDPTSPLRLSDQQTYKHFTHSVWVEKDRPILYTADETNKAIVEAWDVSDPNDIKRTDYFQVENDTDPLTIPHNVFHLQDHLYISWYTEGVRILDTRFPDNLVEVGYYDTYPDKEKGFHGCWSVYPYFKSGLIIASDIEFGMYVMRFDGNRAGYIQGKIRDQQTGLPIYNASIKLSNGTIKHQRFSQLSGIYKTGLSESGLTQIHIEKPGYHSIDTVVDLKSSEVQNIDFYMRELNRHTVQVVLQNQITNDPIPNAKIRLWNDYFSFDATTDLNGACTIRNVYEGQWNVLGGTWGMLHAGDSTINIQNDKTINLKTEAGYEDQFVIDFGWSVKSEDSLVTWKIGDFKELDPPPSNYPTKDIAEDFGNSCYYTDNFNDGSTLNRIKKNIYLNSPVMNLQPYDEIQLSYHAWAYGGWNDAIKEIYLQLNQELIPLEQISERLDGKFNTKSIFKLNLKGKSRDSVRFVFHLYNNPDSTDMAIGLKGALDGFKLVGTILNETENTTSHPLTFYPNPINNELSIVNTHDTNETIYLYNSMGKLIKKINVGPHQNKILSMSNMNSGLIYASYYASEQKQNVTVKLLKK